MITERTAAEIRAYCEAASEGPWTPGLTIGTSCDVRAMSGKRLITHFANVYDRTFVVNARTDLPRVLETAVTERNVLGALEEVGRKISLLVSGGVRLTRLEIMALDDALMGAGAVLSETKWLAGSLSTNAESGRGSENKHEVA